MTDPLEQIQSEGEAAQGGLPGAGLAPASPTFADRAVRLLLPNPAVPEDYRGSAIAAGVNLVLREPAKRAQLGESVSLCVDVMWPESGAGSGMPPIVHLGKSTWDYLRFRGEASEKRAAEKAIRKENQPTK